MGSTLGAYIAITELNLPHIPLDALFWGFHSAHGLIMQQMSSVRLWLIRSDVRITPAPSYVMY
jgi:hypothetical protein